MPDLIKLSEPKLLFGYNQALEDPRDGLMLFGPLDQGKPYGIRAGVIGTKEGISRFKAWVYQIQMPISSTKLPRAHPLFPGFEAVFKIPWSPEAALEIVLSDSDIDRHLYLDDKYQRVYKTVEIYADGILDAIKHEDITPDIWFIVIPDRVHKYCRPKSIVEPEIRVASKNRMLPKRARRTLTSEPALFSEITTAAIPYQYEVNFHNQLKARLLEHRIPTQIVRESTIAPFDFTDKFGRPLRKVEEPSAIAWKISTATFYKVGGRPWKLYGIREGVCYIGIVFKVDETSQDPKSACCAAQMFLDSGDGVVFKGNVGPWYNPKIGDFHLQRNDARELIETALRIYERERGELPKELFIHGKVRFDDEEWEGFKEGVDSSTTLVGVRIKPDNDFKLYRKGNHPVLRGLAYIRDERTAYLWTKGYIPRLQTYPGWEIPKPLLIEICRGEAEIEIVLNDILALTKLNYNSCIFADGLPVTLRFADAVGEILTAGPVPEFVPFPFKFYI